MTPQAPDIVPIAVEAAECGDTVAPEPTNEMIDAATEVLLSSGVIEFPIKADRFAVKRALVAALAVAPS